MPTAITLAGVDFSASAIVKPLPVIAGLDTWAYLGKDLATSQNVGPSGAFSNFSAGPPTYFPNYIHCQNATGALQTQSSWHAPSETLLVACRQTPVGSQIGSQVFIIGNAYNGYLGYSPYVGGSTAVQFFTGGAINFSLITPPITDWRFIAATHGGGVNPMIYDLTKNLSATAGSSTTNTVNAVLKILGSSQSTAIGTNNGACDIAFFGSYNAILTKPQIDAIYASVKQSLGLRGITV